MAAMVRRQARGTEHRAVNRTLSPDLVVRHMTRERGIAASLYLAAAVLALGSFAWGWGHLTYPKTSTSLAVAAVGHRPVTIGYAIFMFLGAIRVGTLEARGTNLQRWLGLSALVYARDGWLRDVRRSRGAFGGDLETRSEHGILA